MSEPSAKLIQTSKTYSIAQMILTLRNYATIEKTYLQTHKSVCLSNNMSHLQSNVIKKNLVFHFPNHTINITDSIEISFPQKFKLEPPPLSQSPSLPINTSKSPQNNLENKKIILFKNKSKNSSQTSARSNKKNIVKNVMGAFLNYFSETLSEQNGNIEHLKKLINKNRYNNKLIRKILDRDQLHFFFRKFLDEAALDWIKNSKLKDKEIHVQAINLYKKLCQQNERKRRCAENQKKQGDSIKQQQQQEQQQYNMFEQGLNHDLENQMSKFK